MDDVPFLRLHHVDPEYPASDGVGGPVDDLREVLVSLNDVVVAPRATFVRHSSADAFL